MKILSIEQKKRRKIMIVTAIISVVLLTAAAAVLYFVVDFDLGDVPADIPEQITITVAWNPGSVADDMARAMSGETQLVLQNIPGTHGAMGLNSVFNQEHDGTNLLSTSLSAFHEVNEMGFAESAPEDWTWWIAAYSPESGEYYGFFVPSSVPQERLNGLEQLITSAVETEIFIEFLEKWGLELVTPERSK